MQTHLRRVNPAFFLTRHKADYVIQQAREKQAQAIVFDVDLSPAQQRNLEELGGVKIIDRTTLILDIFARRAQSREGKIQVELAQLRYLLPRLRGRGEILSRLGAGIGTRGPGETKLEVDRRRIRHRIQNLEKQLERVVSHRQLQRQRRLRRGIPAVAIVGYTNAGKSTLMNTLTDAQVLAEERVFATLDPTCRALRLPGNLPTIVIDTVGFIRDLPPELVAAFRATLEEIRNAEVLIHIVDASDPQLTLKVQLTEEVLKTLSVQDLPVLYVFNKLDRVDDPLILNALQQRFAPSVAVSAKQNWAIEQLLRELKQLICSTLNIQHLSIPYADTKVLSELEKRGDILSIRYTEQGVELLSRLHGPLEQEYLSYLSSS